MKYIKQFDSLRAIAVILVIISHWFSKDHILNSLPNGKIGVDIFFVLSGFLITMILLESRNKSETSPILKSTLVKFFYIRRTLRIFPVYYLTLFILIIFLKGMIDTNIQEGFKYFVTYTTNFYYFGLKEFPGTLSHLWTLAVEEQFYLVWPWIILYFSKKYLLHAIILFIVIGVLSQYLLSNLKMSTLLPFTCFDSFGLGALLSWQITFKPAFLKKFYFIVSLTGIVGVALFFLGVTKNIWILPVRTTISIVALWIITYIFVYSESEKMKFKFVLNNSIFIFIGKISYGIYLFHTIIPVTINAKLINIYFNPLLPDFIFRQHWGVLIVIENSIFLILISWLSYILIEKPFLHLKKYFNYQNTKTNIPIQTVNV
jgi:peptidoglycan/LPS O-acetylase OafA/YrhL